MKVTDIMGPREMKAKKPVPTRRKLIDFLKPEKSEAPNTTRDGMRFQA